MGAVSACQLYSQLRTHAGALLRYLTQFSLHAEAQLLPFQKATSRLREHLLSAGPGNPMKIARKRILVVESDDNSVEMLRLYHGYANYRVMAADTCGECLQLARKQAAAFITVSIERKHNHDSRSPSS